ncbi:MAG: glycosyl transferase family 1, partial [Sphingomonadales bacterium]
MHLVYFANDLHDSAIERRIRMLLQGGASVALAGFHRQAEVPAKVAGLIPTSLGRTRDARLADRALMVARHTVAASTLTPLLDNADIVIARNLEMLVIAARVIAASGRSVPLVYELLDVHRLLAGDGLVGRSMRRLERWGIGRSAGIILSSPAFASEHLARHYPDLPPTILVENKILDLSSVRPSATAPAAPPWRIGWFGILRCRQSLTALAAIAARLGDRVEIDLRGVIGLPIADMIDDILARHANIRFQGRYTNPGDLQQVYGQVHFAWAIDYYEQGLNSTWLLPN